MYNGSATGYQWFDWRCRTLPVLRLFAVLLSSTISFSSVHIYKQIPHKKIKNNKNIWHENESEITLKKLKLARGVCQRIILMFTCKPL